MRLPGGMLWPLGYLKTPPSDVKLDAGQIRGPFPEPYVEGQAMGQSHPVPQGRRAWGARGRRRESIADRHAH